MQDPGGVVYLAVGIVGAGHRGVPGTLQGLAVQLVSGLQVQDHQVKARCRAAGGAVRIEAQALVFVAVPTAAEQVDRLLGIPYLLDRLGRQADGVEAALGPGETVHERGRHRLLLAEDVPVVDIVVDAGGQPAAALLRQREVQDRVEAQETGDRVVDPELVGIGVEARGSFTNGVPCGSLV